MTLMMMLVWMMYIAYMIMYSKKLKRSAGVPPNSAGGLPTQQLKFDSSEFHARFWYFVWISLMVVGALTFFEVMHPPELEMILPPIPWIRPNLPTLNLPQGIKSSWMIVIVLLFTALAVYRDSKKQRSARISLNSPHGLPTSLPGLTGPEIRAYFFDFLMISLTVLGLLLILDVMDLPPLNLTKILSLHQPEVTPRQFTKLALEFIWAHSPYLMGFITLFFLWLVVRTVRKKQTKKPFSG